MENYSNIRGWLLNIAQRALPHNVYLEVHNLIVTLETEGKSARHVVKRVLKEIHDKFLEVVD